MDNFIEIINSKNMVEFKKFFDSCEINAIIKCSDNMNSFSFGNLTIDQIKFLIDNGLDVNSNCGKGLPAVAFQSGNLENLKFLIENGADINLKLSSYPGSAILFLLQ